MRKGKYKSLLKIVAESEGISVDEVENEMQRAIDAGFNSTDQSIREEWKRIPFKGNKPTIKEVLEYFLKQIRNQN